jgi:uncharacterized damage-inducible protein DinB
MTEVERIQDQLERAFHGDAWHGPSIRQVLSGVTARQAAARPIGEGHSIWELVLHMRAWTEIPRRRLVEDRVLEATPQEDWPASGEPDPASWEEDVKALFDAEERLQRVLTDFPEHRLQETVPGHDYSFYIMLHGVVQHGLYHAGQVAILRKEKAQPRL